jgi:hypothetical protein
MGGYSFYYVAAFEIDVKNTADNTAKLFFSDLKRLLHKAL